MILGKSLSGAITLSPRHGPDDITVSGVSDGQSTHTEIFSTRGSKLVVVSSIVMDTSLGQHGVVLYLRLPQGWGVIGDDDQLGLSIPQGLDSLLVAKHKLTRLHNQSKSGVDGLIGFLCFLILDSHFF